MTAAPATSRPIDRRRAETRREIIEAAWEACRAEGLAGLSLRDLAGRVGLRAPSLYSYFASKNAIYDAMYVEGQSALLERLEQLPTEDVTRQDLYLGARAFFEFCSEDPVRYQLLFQHVVPGFVPSPEAHALAAATIARMGRTFAAGGVTGPRHGDLWTAVITGLIDRQITDDPGGDRWSRLIEEAVDLVADHAQRTS